MDRYDTIAEAYRDSKELTFRDVIETYTLFEMLGDVGGKTVLDMGCGDGFYTRLLKRAGAGEVTGVDISGEMIRLATEEESRRPLGCLYRHRDARTFQPCARVDLVLASFLLHYAKSDEELRRFCRACLDALRPGGRFVGFVANTHIPLKGTISWKKYGIVKVYPQTRRDGGVITVRITNDDGREFEFENCFFAPLTYRKAFDEAGFADFRWVEPELHPNERNNPFWDDFLRIPPFMAFSASRGRS